MPRLIDCRRLLVWLSGAAAGTALAFQADGADAAQRRRAARRTRRRVRRRVRRRIRRRIVTRVVAGRRVWVAPVALAVGWELELAANRVVVVKETKFVARAGTRVEIVVVQDSKGKQQELEIVREDTTGNAKNLQGSVLPGDDKTTPAVEAEEDVDE